MGFLDWILGRSTPAPAPSQHERSSPAADRGVAVLEAPPARDDASAEGTDAVTAAHWWEPDDGHLTELVEPPRPEMPPEARAFEELLISHFDGHDLRLPPLLDTAERVLPLLADIRCDSRKIAEALSHDQVITAAVLRMANSPLYRGVQKITSLQPAVTRLGTRALRTLLMNESLRAATFGRHGEDNRLAIFIWRKALASACVMRRIAELTRTDPEEAFLAGLMHDIGEVVVLRIFHDKSAMTRQQLRLDAPLFAYLCHETHQEFGELIADAWSLPDGLKAVIANHHTYPGADDPYRTPRLQLHLTDMIVSLLGFAPYAPYVPADARAAHDLGLAGRFDYVEMLHDLPDYVEETVTVL